MTHLPLVIAALLIASCDVGRTTESAPPPATPPAERVEHDTMLRFHMHANFDLLRAIEKLVIHGKLAEAKLLARALAVAPEEPGLSAFATHRKRVRDLAQALAEAPSTDEACRREARLAVACASCHAAAGVVPVLAHTPALPPDQPTLEARMARHRWAADRLWEATVGGGDEPWLKGLEVLAQTPYPFRKSFDDRAGLARRLQQLADQGRKQMGTDTIAERGRIYGEMLVVCASCHATPSPPVLPSEL
jgi:cytochrome c553